MDPEYTCEKEAHDRNSFLVEKHGKIPSYGLWREEDIEKESIESRYNWWNTENVNNNYVINWKYYLWKLINNVMEDSHPGPSTSREMQ